MVKDQLKELRTNNNLSITEFAKAIGVSGTSVSLYESGKQNPGSKTIDRICQKFGVDKEWLLGEAEKVATKVTDGVKELEKQSKKKGTKKKETTESVPAPVEEKVEEPKKEEPVAAEPVAEAPKAEAKPEEKPAKKTRAKKEKPVETVKEEKKEEIEEPIKEEKSEMKKEEKKESAKKSAKTEKTVNVSVMIESAMGGQIALEEIIRRVKEKTGDAKDLTVYVKPEENKAYFTAEKTVGSVDLW